MTEIGNCPWCGGTAELFGGAPHWAGCSMGKCLASGPSGSDPELAIAAWNKLAGPDVVVGPLRWVCGPGPARIGG